MNCETRQVLVAKALQSIRVVLEQLEVALFADEKKPDLSRFFNPECQREFELLDKLNTLCPVERPFGGLPLPKETFMTK